jgi:Flp pilus assembly protein TadD
MQPDQWPKYKYLLLELWNPQEPVLNEVLAGERSQCRSEVFRALYENNKIAYCSEHRKPEEKLTTREHERIFKQTSDAHSGLLKNLGAAALSEEAMREATSTFKRTTELTPEDVDTWSEVSEATEEHDGQSAEDQS